MFLVLQSCKSKESKEESNTEILEQKKNDLTLSQISDSINSYNFEVSDSIIINSYQRNKYKSFWFNNDASLSEEGISFIELINDANSFGLNKANYSVDKIESLVLNCTPQVTSIAEATLLDIELTRSYVKMANHFHYGHIVDHSYFTDLTTHNDKIDFESVLIKGSLIKNLLSLQPKHQEYHQLQKALSLFVKTNIISDTIVAIPNFRKDSVKAYEVTKSILIRKQYLENSATGEEVIEAVKQFQKDNGLISDGLIGKHTAQMLEYSTSNIYFQAAITLEKWRWIEEWGENYFFANIPEFTFKVYEGDSVIINNKTVVGTAATQTPEIESKLKYFIVNPEWHVPYSITTKELIPKMKKDSTYLARNNYAISSNGVNISDIDWANANPATFNYKIKQKSGGSNALGKVKFIFDNKHSVYFHDTPSKSFFDKEIRSYSHGCIRLQNPFDVAEYIIEKENKDEWIDLLDSVRSKKITKTFTPSGEYPIHIGYFTSSGDKNQRLKTMLDIYERNDTLLSRFKEFYFNSAN